MELAIKGHLTRGNEVIKILEILGGINLRKLEGINPNYYYTIDDDWTISGIINTYLGNNHVHYTIEEFLEKFPYKVGDKVIIKVTNQEAIIDKVVWCCDTIIYWLKYDDCLEGNWRTEHLRPYKEETMEEKIQAYEVTEEICANEIAIEFDPSKLEMIERNGKYFIVKKQPQYPKTYEECCKIMQVARPIIWFDYNDVSSISEEGDEYERHIENTLCSFRELLICRDTYWRIAGEQMGLGKPWEPELNSKKHKFALSNVGGNISFEVYGEYNSVLCFPTEEMREEFYKNFKELIEICKELL